MARSRRRKRRTPSRREATPGWAWLAAGFALGLVAAFALYVAQRPPAPGSGGLPAAAGAAPADAGADLETVTPVAASPVQGREEAPPEAGEAPASGPRFEFYELLPEFEVVVPEVESHARAAPPPARVSEPGRYVLQVGSFTEIADADRMQANLALLGIESRLQRVAIDDRVFHRVRIGPLEDLDRVNRIREQLSEARIDSLLMRAPEQ